MIESTIEPNSPQATQPRICHVVASINRDTGGTAAAVANLTEVLAQLDIDCHLFTLDYKNCGSQIPTSGIKLHSYPATMAARYLRGWQLDASHALWQLAATELDLIHNHGLWMFPNLYARQAAVGNQIPLVISPEGMLESWSLKHSRYKKWLAWQLYERKNLSNATVFQATSLAEVASIKNLGYTQNVALIPNGVSIPDLDLLPDKAITIAQFPELKDKKWLLFLSRIHPKKGLDNLLYVWEALAQKFPDWHLIIAGPDLTGYQVTLEKIVSQLQLETSVTFTGMLSGEIKASALGNADLFVLPTHSENFGIAVAESLAYRVPVITTKSAPWQDLIDYECGWWIEDDRGALALALTEAMQLEDRDRYEMGCKGRMMVQTKYSWHSVGKEMSELYRWILAGGSVPNCIRSTMDA
jgi:glycosyltransferase involved in cell wall biosynthesis